MKRDENGEVSRMVVIMMPIAMMMTLNMLEMEMNYWHGDEDEKHCPTDYCDENCDKHANVHAADNKDGDISKVLCD